MSDSGIAPLAGVRVLDLSRVFAGPLCTMALGDLGAEIIKVEHPVRGDDTRDWGMHVCPTRTTYFNCANRNKRSITLDLSTEAGQHIARKLAAECDVVVQNFKLGGAAKMRLGYEDLKAIRPDIVYCSIAGYNSSGPEASRPGYDLVLQAETGLMHMNGEPTQPPLKFGTSVVDMFTGMYAAQAILAALYHRKGTGEGRHIEMSLYDSGISISAFYGLESLWRGEDVPRYGNAHPSIIPYGVFDAQDGSLVIAVGNNAQFVRFCTDVIDQPSLKDDERFSTNVARSRNRDTLLPIIRQAVGARKRAELLERLHAAGIPCGEVLGLHEALSSARTRQGKLIETFPVPEERDAHVMAPPYRLDGQRPPVRHVPPTLGEGTDDILQSLLGLSHDELAQLRGKGVI
ncbi:CoA transferase [Pusillimonas sp. TS35]|uniref:CaiB/BaiF CoA transferase family protein n=1 Tax=Paracandidimonas lactea TaxID=2895524 RepID=UPI001370A42C|nr:CoA transferase [Paracandidimonas lactea]MYN13481.1 CoA transferase [Pusillimonas sp. TS35]